MLRVSGNEMRCECQRDRDEDADGDESVGDDKNEVVRESSKILDEKRMSYDGRKGGCLWGTQSAIGDQIPVLAFGCTRQVDESERQVRVVRDRLHRLGTRLEVILRS